MKRIIVLVCLFASPAFAQQQTPADVALQINNVIGQWAQMLAQQSRQIEELQKQLAAKQKEIDDLKAKQ